MSPEGRTNSPSLQCVAFSADGKTLAAGWQDQTICLWDPETLKKRGVSDKISNATIHATFPGDFDICFFPVGAWLNLAQCKAFHSRGERALFSRTGVIGNPIGHSLSPLMQNAAFAASRLDWHYSASFPAVC